MKLRIVFIYLLFTATFLAVSAYAQSPQETLNQYISDLRSNPNDTALREKIIKLAQEMKPAPVIPEEARKHINRGMAAAEDARNENDYKDAAEEFQKAVNITPWLGVGYRGLAVTQDKAGLYSQALRNLKLFLLTNPSTADVEAAKVLMDKIEYRQEKAARESSAKAVATPKQDPLEALLKKINGRRYTYGRASGEYIMEVIDVRGKVLVMGWIGDPNYSGTRGYHEDSGPAGRIEVKGRETVVPSIRILEGPSKGQWSAQLTFIIGEDGDRITVRSRWPDGDVWDHVYLWQR